MNPPNFVELLFAKKWLDLGSWWATKRFAFTKRTYRAEVIVALRDTLHVTMKKAQNAISLKRKTKIIWHTADARREEEMAQLRLQLLHGCESLSHFAYIYEENTKAISLKRKTKINWHTADARREEEMAKLRLKLLHGHESLSQLHEVKVAVTSGLVVFHARQPVEYESLRPIRESTSLTEGKKKTK